jgi:hypothetical protein
MAMVLTLRAERRRLPAERPGIGAFDQIFTVGVPLRTPISVLDGPAGGPLAGMNRRDGGLEIGWLMFGRLAAGLPLLAGYLTERGCSELRVGLVDFEEVRGD